MININYSNAAREATIDIDGTIGLDWWSDNPEANTAISIKDQLKTISNMKAETITVNINSLGGDVNDGIAIHDALAMHPATVNVKITGMTASAATIIAMAGDTIEMSDNALFLVHRAWTGVMGNKNNLEAVGDTLDVIDNTIATIYSKRTGMSLENAFSLMDANNGDGEWLTADEALENGFIDSVFEPMQAAAAIPSKQIAAMKLPTIPNNKLNKMSDVSNTPEMSNDMEEVKNDVKTLWNKIFGTKEEVKAETEVIEEVETVDFEAINADLTSELETLKGELEAKNEEIETLTNNQEEVRTEMEALNNKVEELSKLPVSKDVDAVVETPKAKGNLEEIFNTIQKKNK